MPTSTIIPVLGYPDVRAAVDWLCGAFGFTERLRIGDHRAQLSFGDGNMVVAEGKPVSAANHSIMVRVMDVDQHCERARKFGANILSAPTDFPYGERQYSVEDLGGHHWKFSQSITDVEPASWGGTLIES